MTDLCKAARGRECQVRIPGVCNGNDETSVLAHIRLAGLCGTGLNRLTSLQQSHVPPAMTKSIAAPGWSTPNMRMSAHWREWPARRLSG